MTLGIEALLTDDRSAGAPSSRLTSLTKKVVHPERVPTSRARKLAQADRQFLSHHDCNRA